jgi:hypothetical protein
MANALGIDILGVQDIDPFLTLGSRRESAAHIVLRSLFHDPGALWWAPDRGYHLVHRLHTFFDPDAIESAVRAQLEASELVESVDVVATALGRELRLEIDLKLTNDPNAVTLTLQVSELGEVLLDNGA